MPATHALTDLPPTPAIHKCFANATALPSMAEVASRLLRSFDRQDLAMGELAALISQGQGSSVKLLRLANSARFSPCQTIATIEDAAADPLARRPFSRLGAVLRLASVMSDAGDRQLPAVATLLQTQADLVAHRHLDRDWLGQHMAPYAELTSGVDQLLH